MIVKYLLIMIYTLKIVVRFFRLKAIRILFLSADSLIFNIDSELLEDKHDDETISVYRKSHRFVFS